MDSLNLQKFTSKLQENDVNDLASVSQLTLDDLKEMGFSIGARNKMLAKIESIKQGGGTSTNKGLLDSTASGTFAASKTESKIGSNNKLDQ